MRTIRLAVWGDDEVNRVTVHEKTFDVFDAALGSDALFVAAQEAKAYRDGYFAGQGWDMGENTAAPEGGYRGDVSVGMGEKLEWSITLEA